MLGAVRAAVEDTIVFGAVADDAAAAVGAGRGQHVDGAFERIEGAVAERAGDGEGLVVIVAADVASGHGGDLGTGECSVFACVSTHGEEARQAKVHWNPAY